MRTSAKPFLIVVGLVLLTIAATGCFTSGADTQENAGMPIEQELQAQAQPTIKAEDSQEMPASTTTTEKPMFVEVVSATSPVSPGGNPVTVFIKTKPGAISEIELGYQGGQNEEGALYSKQANASGMISWTWTVDPSVPYGAYPVVVTAKSLDGQTAVAKSTLEVKSAEECKS
ncbi:MAG: hypothetical protein Q8J63_09340 [Candidatus Aquicultor sp.]|nr:hypothetical protein [Candidatus Aquicultor sp.]